MRLSNHGVDDAHAARQLTGHRTFHRHRAGKRSSRIRFPFGTAGSKRHGDAQLGGRRSPRYTPAPRCQRDSRGESLPAWRCSADRREDSGDRADASRDIGTRNRVISGSRDPAGYGTNWQPHGFLHEAGLDRVRLLRRSFGIRLYVGRIRRPHHASNARLRVRRDCPRANAAVDAQCGHTSRRDRFPPRRQRGVRRTSVSTNSEVVHP